MKEQANKNNNLGGQKLKGTDLNGILIKKNPISKSHPQISGTSRFCLLVESWRMPFLALKKKIE